LLGDANGDRAIDAIDASMMRQTFGRSAGESEFQDSLDLNNDGHVDAADLRILRSRLGMKLVL